MNKKLLALVGGYVAGMAFWSKKRQDDGTSKLKKPLLQSTISEIIDEIVDMHTLAYDEVKNRVEPLFEEVKDFDTLKTRMNEMIETFEKKWESTLADAKEVTADKREMLAEKFDASKKHLEGTLDTAKTRANDLKDTTSSTVDTWVSDAEEKIKEIYTKIKTNFDKK
ncbi:hypothetical protein KGV55_01715 [Candidatus Gracilibacteria bacterium]|nr:hypothetical protein [Candidatus Gracilibacteria bacterium]